MRCDARRTPPSWSFRCDRFYKREWASSTRLASLSSLSVDGHALTAPFPIFTVCVIFQGLKLLDAHRDEEVGGTHGVAAGVHVEGAPRWRDVPDPDPFEMDVMNWTEPFNAQARGN